MENSVNAVQNERNSTTVSRNIHREFYVKIIDIRPEFTSSTNRIDNFKLNW